MPSAGPERFCLKMLRRFLFQSVFAVMNSALDEDLLAFAKELLGDLRLLPPHNDVVPLSPGLLFALRVLP